MKKQIFYIVSLLLSFSVFIGTASAANDATFSASSEKTTYTVGDDIKVNLSVDAGTFDTTLSVIDMKVKISDPAVAEVTNTAEPLTLGSIYTSKVTMSYASGVMSAAVFVDPNNKPAKRSGVIGTINMKALKEGQTTISYDTIQATQENDELNFITTAASSLTINVVPAQVVPATTTNNQPSTPQVTTTRAAVAAATTVSTGPEEMLLFALLGGSLIFIVFKILKSAKRSEGRL